MSEEKLIAEIGDDKIIYVIYEQNKKSQYKIIKEKISEKTGIKNGKILDFNYTSTRIKKDINSIEKDLDKIFRNITIIINEIDISCTNLSGFKKLNGSRVEKRDFDYILNEAKSSVIKNQENNSILHILNSNFILDRIKKKKMPLDLRGDHLSMHITFISLPKSNLKNITALFEDNDIKIDRIISKPLACGMNLLDKNKGAKNFILINFEKNISSVSMYEDSSLVFLRTFPFGTDSIYRDIRQLCSLSENEIKYIIKDLDLTKGETKKNIYVDKNYFKETEFKKLNINYLCNIIKARIDEMLNYLFNENKNLHYTNNNIFRIHLFFEDKEILENLGKLFTNSLKVDGSKTQIELIELNDFLALSGAAELIFKGWDKEAIPLNFRKKSVIAGFFERFL